MNTHFVQRRWGSAEMLFTIAAGVTLIITAGILGRSFAASVARADTAEPVLSSVQSAPTDTGATITWQSDMPSDSQVLYGTTSVYSSSTTPDSTEVSSHSVLLSGLMPSTLYHFAVVSTNASSSQTLSPDQTFTTLAASSSSTGTTTATTTDTVAPVVSSVVITPMATSAQITWMTDEAASSQIKYGLTSAYGASTTLDSTLVTSHTVTVWGLSAGTIYHFSIVSADASNNTSVPVDMTFTTNTAPTSSGGTLDLQTLQNEIVALQNAILALEAQIQSILNGNSTGGTGGTTTPPTTTGTGTIDQNGATVSAGGSIDFVGRNFGHEENVTVALNGNTVTQAHADGGGNFSTGSLSVPSTAGTYTYTFTGQNSGITGTAVITVH